MFSQFLVGLNSHDESEYVHDCPQRKKSCPFHVKTMCIMETGLHYLTNQAHFIFIVQRSLFNDYLIRNIFLVRYKICISETMESFTS